MFVKAADLAIEHIIKKNKIPVITGGTGLYIKALLHGLFRSKSIDKKQLSQLEKKLIDKGKLFLYRQLEECDPDAAKSIHPNDSFRIIRALEFFMTNNQKISNSQKNHNFDDQRYSFVKIGLYMDRKKLYERINQRVNIMLSQDLLKEVTNLVKKGYSLDLKSMQSIGYKQIGMFLKNKVEWEEAVRLLKRDTRRYAKRQFTWFKKDKQINWIKPCEINKAKALINAFIASTTYEKFL